MIRLIINADDFGYCSERNRAIGDLFKAKLISSTSLLVNGLEAENACRLADAIDLPMGLHWNLTEGQPISKRQMTSLVDQKGQMHGKFGLRTKLDQGEILRQDLIEELEQQILKYQQLTRGKLPKHVDGHQHIHVHPMVVDCVVELMKKYRIKYVRAPFDRLVSSTNEKFPFYQQIFEQTALAKKIFDKNQLKYPEYFFGMTTMGSSMTLSNIEMCFRSVPSNSFVTAELMCHPGYPNDGIHGGCGQNSPPDLFSQSFERQIEYNFLTTNALKELFHRYNVHLCTYDHLNINMLNDDEVNVDANPYE